MKDLEIYIKLLALPDELKMEANHFIEFLKTKKKLEKDKIKRVPGLAKGLIEISDDFDEPLEDFKQYQ